MKFDNADYCKIKYTSKSSLRRPEQPEMTLQQTMERTPQLNQRLNYLKLNQHVNCVVKVNAILVFRLHVQRRRKPTRIGMASFPFPLTFFPSTFPSRRHFFSFLSLASALRFPPFFSLPIPSPSPILHPSLSRRSRTPLNPDRDLGERCQLPAGSGEPQPKSILMHFSL